MTWFDDALKVIKTFVTTHKNLLVFAACVLLAIIVIRGFFRWKWLARLVGLDEKIRIREARREARRYENQGDLLEAARRWEAVGEKEHAVKLAVKAGHHSYAGELYQNLGRRMDAAFQFTKAEMWDQAAPLFEAGGQIDQAADAYHRAHRPILAAEMFVKAGRREEAARCYLEVGQLRRAADMLLAAGQRARAADVYDRLSVELAGKKSATERDLGELREVSRIAADLFKELGDLRKAGIMYERAGDLVEAGEALVSQKDFKTAASMFRRAGRTDLAAEAYESGGDRRSAALSRSEKLVAAGKLAEAAAELEKESEYGRAAVLRSQAGQAEEAAADYAKAGMHREAGTALAQAGKILEAAQAYEKAGAHAFAEQHYRKLGDIQLLLAHFRRRGDPMASGKLLVENLDYAAAILELQQIEPKDKAYGEAVGLLAHCFMRIGRTDLAMIRYDEVVHSVQATFATVRIYYEYACLLEQEGRTGEALNLYDQVVSVHARYADAATRAEDIRHKMRGGSQSPPTELIEQAKFELAGGEAPERYQVIAEVSRGSEGIVYRAADTMLNRDVAIKVLSQDLRAIPLARQRFLEEGRALAVLDHPNILRILDVVEEGDQVHLVTEFVQGDTLKTVVEKEKKLPVAEVIPIAEAICSALAYAHRHKIIHRDIKPANIIRVAGGGVKVLDFGLAKMLDLSEEATRQAEATICGTPRYMSPEQILGRTVDVRTDIYSLGATLFELLAGRPPFTGGDLLYQHLYDPPPPLTDFAPDAPPGLAQALKKALKKAPEERFSSADDFLVALKAAVA